MFCSKCGAPNEDDAEYCGNCGALLEAADEPSAESPSTIEPVAGTAALTDTSETQPEVPAVPAAPPVEERVVAEPTATEPGRAADSGLGVPDSTVKPGPAVAMRNPSPETAFLIEFLAGIFGLLGVGYLFAGKTNEGVVKLVVWLVYTILAWVAIGLLSAIVVGVVCIPFQLVLQIGVPLWSANKLKKQLLAEG